MKTYPTLISEAEVTKKKMRTEKMTRILAIILAGTSVFIFFFKLIFF